MAKKIFVAATGQHMGKTTTTLGLVANLKEQGYDVGYCKPVGQKYVNIDGAIADKDAVLFAQMLDFKVSPDLHSPVVLGSGVTADFIEDPSQFNFNKRLLDASARLEEMHDVVVYEGTGHPGVGSVVNLSNAKVAKMLGAGVVMVVEGGIGNTIDRLNMSLALFREEQVPLLGVIINKVQVDKREKVMKYVGKKLKQMNIPLLGVIPYDQSLSFPILATVCKAVTAKVISNHNQLFNRVEQTLAGSLVDIDEFNTYQNILLVASSKRFNEAVGKIQSIALNGNLETCPLSGVLITGDGRHENWYSEADFGNNYLKENKVPILTTTLDTYGSVVKISRIEVKINTRTPWKVQRAIELTKAHVDLQAILETELP